MKLSSVKSLLQTLEQISFQLPNGTLVPSHFHVTEVGKISKHFIDCGGTVRKEEVISFQLWNANDYDHRLHPDKLLNIITLSEKILELEDLEIEVEYQGETIQKFGLEYAENAFQLTTKFTECLAEDACGIPAAKDKPRITLNVMGCDPNSGCC